MSKWKTWIAVVVALFLGWYAGGRFSSRPVSSTLADTKSPSTQPGERKIAYWWDPMYNPPYISDKPGKSPMGMDLEPVYEDENRGSARMKIDPTIVQNMGVRTVAVKRGPLVSEIRASGRLREVEPNVHDINLRVDGWIEKISADTLGGRVEKDQPLFEIYSPQLQAAIGELMAAKKSGDPTLLNASGQKLLLWGLSESQVADFAKREAVPRTVTFVSPVSGNVTEKMVVAGAMIKSGERAMRIVDLSRLWMDVQIFEGDLPGVRIGQKVVATIDALPGEQVVGEVIFVSPGVDDMTRTAVARVEIPNPKSNLKPGMFVTAGVRLELASDAVTLPREAVLDSGRRRIAFIASEGGHFDPRELKVGRETSDGTVEILEGVSPGEQVVVNGQFLLDAESRLREAIQRFREAKSSTTPATPNDSSNESHDHSGHHHH